MFNTVQLGIIEKIEGKVNARIRIPTLHGEIGAKSCIPTDLLPLAVPCVSPVFREDYANIDLNIGEKLYVMEVQEGGYYLYLGKEFRKDEGDSAKKFYLFSESRGDAWDNTEEVSETKAKRPPAVQAFDGIHFNAEDNVFEIISGKKASGNLQDYCGIKLSAETGNITLIAKKGNKKVTFELSATSGTIIQTVSSGNTILSQQVLDDENMYLKADKVINFKSKVISENEYTPYETPSLGTDSKVWDGKVAENDSLNYDK